MSWSAAEIQALAGKAARGAGAAPEQAARFGKAAAWHLMAGRAPQALDAALRMLPGGPVMQLPVKLDAALATGGPEATCILDAPGELVECYIATLPCMISARQHKDHWHLTFDPGQPQTRPRPRRIDGIDDLITQMTALAERTYVPESEASREAGAGAGLSDND